MLKALGYILSIFQYVAEYFNRKQLIDAGKAQAERDALHENIKQRNIADAARADVDNSVDQLLDDPNRRK